MSIAETTSTGLAASDGRPARPVWPDRLLSLAVLAGTGGILATATLLEADPSGLGTHQTLGLPPCGFQLNVGLPCATCGMTTAFTHAAHGHLLSSLQTQPAGAVLAVLTAAFALLSVYSLITRTSMRPIFAWAWRVRTVVALAALVLAAWAYKILSVQGML